MRERDERDETFVQILTERVQKSNCDAGRLVTVLDMRPSTTNTITTNRATKITAHCKLTLLWISYSNPNSLGTRANEPRRSLPQLRKQAQTINATTTGMWHSNYAKPVIMPKAIGPL